MKFGEERKKIHAKKIMQASFQAVFTIPKKNSDTHTSSEMDAATRNAMIWLEQRLLAVKAQDKARKSFSNVPIFNESLYTK